MSEIKENGADLAPETMGPATDAGETTAKPESANIRGTYKTVQQLAHEYGMSKNGIMTRIGKLLKEIKENGLDESEYISRGLKNTIYVLEPGLAWFAKFQADNTPMQSISISPEVQKLEQSEELNSHLKAEIEILKRQLEYLQTDLNEKNKQITARNDQINAQDSQISLLVGTIAQQAKIIDNQSNELLRLTAPKPEPMGETAEETTAQNVENDPKTVVSVSDEQIAEAMSKRSFMSKLKLLFS